MLAIAFNKWLLIDIVTFMDLPVADFFKWLSTNILVSTNAKVFLSVSLSRL